MKTPISLMALATLSVLITTGYSNARTSAAVNDGSPEVFHVRSFQASLSCIDPHPGEVRKCDELERQILASTVRLVFHRWVENEDGRTYTFVNGATAHATLKAGGYLVTHNHLNIMRTDRKDGERITISVLDASGELILSGAPVEAIRIAAEDPETLVLDLGGCLDGEYDDMLELPSAKFKSWYSLPIQPGMEVAQVNWDGATTYVDWVVIEDVIEDGGTPRLELSNIVGSGASGGGVYWNGYHIANTWSQVTVLDENGGSVARQYSVAALDSLQVAAPLGLSEGALAKSPLSTQPAFSGVRPPSIFCS